MQNLRIFFFFLVLNVIAFFLLAGQYGFYEDDYNLIANFLDQPLHFISLLRPFFNSFMEWPAGRPLGNSFPIATTIFFNNLTGIAGLRFLGLLILTLNPFLIYKIALKVIQDKQLALFIAVLFLLFPAETTHMYLLHNLQCHLAVLFTLLGSYFYLADKKTFSYATAFLTLLTYESPFMLFPFIPLLKNVRSKITKREFFKHLAICISLVAIYLFIRSSLHDTRIDYIQTNFKEVVLKIGNSLAYGPIISLTSYFKSFLFLKKIDLLPGILFGVTSGIVVFFVFKMDKHDVVLSKNTFAKLILIAILLLVVSYATSFSYDVKSAHGRLSSVHLSASVGASMLIALGYVLLLRLCRKKTFRFILMAALFVQIFSLFNFSFQIQKSFALSWQRQKEDWSKILPLIDDFDPSKVLLVVFKDKNKNDVNFIEPRAHWIEIVVPLIYDYGRKYHFGALKAYEGDLRSLANRFVKEGDKVFLKSFVDERNGHFLKLFEIKNNIIAIVEEDNGFKRVSGKFSLSDDIHFVLPAPSVSQKRPKRILFDYLMEK